MSPSMAAEAFNSTFWGWIRGITPYETTYGGVIGGQRRRYHPRWGQSEQSGDSRGAYDHAVGLSGEHVGAIQALLPHQVARLEHQVAHRAHQVVLHMAPNCPQIYPGDCMGQEGRSWVQL